jgi:YfiH family protein
MFLTADPLAQVPGIRHGFFTRARAGNTGSEGSIYQGLNCGFGSSDDATTVRANRAAAMQALGFPAEALGTPHQVHSAKALIIRDPAEATGQKLDALVTNTPGVVLGILTADCSPLLFCDPLAKVVGAAHAGWKGARFGVASATLRKMESLGAHRSRIRAAIGPTIGAQSYEVGPEFPTHFLSQSPANARFFRRPKGSARAYFDLPGYLEHQLRALGLASVTNLREDTVTDANRFFSYRRSVLRKEPDYGRLLTAIAITH